MYQRQFQVALRTVNGAGYLTSVNGDIKDSAGNAIGAISSSGIALTGFGVGLAAGNKTPNGGNIVTTGVGEFDAGVIAGSLDDGVPQGDVLTNQVYCTEVNFKSTVFGSGGSTVFKIKSGTVGTPSNGQALTYESSSSAVKWAAVSYSSLSGLPTLFSGSYEDLSNKPTLFDDSTLSTVATSGDFDDLSNKPTLFDGAYSSLTGKPTTINYELASYQAGQHRRRRPSQSG